jgi:hypothetical protein
MLVVSFLLLTLWLSALVFDFGLGSFAHAFAITAVLIVFARRSPRARHSRMARS